MDMMTLRRSIMQSRQLPPGYQRVEYVSGTGTQYINSGIECTSDLSIEFAFLVSSDVNAALCGGIDTRSPIFRHHGTLYNFPDATKFMYMYSLNEVRSIPTSISPPQINTKYNVSIDATNGTYLFDGINYHEAGSFTPFAARTTGRNYGILGRISHTGAIQSRPNQTYYFKFWRGGKLIGDFIPCYRKSDNEPGMYDLVTNTFFTNAGTGTIGVGPDV